MAQRQNPNRRVPFGESDLNKLCDVYGKVPYEVAHTLIRESAIWLTHRHGPCRAPRHANRITESFGQWYLQLGANRFDISRAVVLCKSTLEIFCKANKDVSSTDIRTLKEDLRSNLRSSVVNQIGARYDRYSLDGSMMRFGATGLDTECMLRAILRIAGMPVV